MSICQPLPCADLGSPYCPCALASAGQCVYCTRLRGENRCGCDWAGVCVMLHRAEGPGPEVRQPFETAVRKTRPATVTAVRTASQGVCEMWLTASPSLSAQLSLPGTFVMIRAASSPETYAVPLTVAGVRGDAFRLIFKVAGPKTQTFAALAARQGVVWRGPYRSGLLGRRRLLEDRSRPAVIVARGLGQAVALPVVTHLVRQGRAAVVLLDPRGWGKDFARSELEAGCRRPVLAIACMDEKGAAQLASTLSEFTQGVGPLLISCGSDIQHRWLVGLRGGLVEACGGKTVEYVAGNNSLIVCAEGVCGACVGRLPNGKRFRGCKADVMPELLWGEDAIGR